VLVLVENWQFPSNGPVDQKFHVEGFAPNQPFFFSEN